MPARLIGGAMEPVEEPCALALRDPRSTVVDRQERPVPGRTDENPDPSVLAGVAARVVDQHAREAGRGADQGGGVPPAVVDGDQPSVVAQPGDRPPGQCGLADPADTGQDRAAGDAELADGGVGVAEDGGRDATARFSQPLVIR